MLERKVWIQMEVIYAQYALIMTIPDVTKATNN